MRRVVQISDIHFGNNDPLLLAPLREAIERINPHVLVISGDLVEHASDDEFRQARAFIDTLPHPQIIVPGNHDLAFYNFARRMLVGLDTYRKFITDDLSPEFEDDEIAIVGANTSRIHQIRGGSLSSVQLESLFARFSAFPKQLVRILVTHHPFDLPDTQQRHLIVGHARRSVVRLAPVVDILLAGHIHVSSTGSTAHRYRTPEHSMAFVQAGTAVSNRFKGEENSFNSLRIMPDLDGHKTLIVDRYAWDKTDSRFHCHQSSEFRLEESGWNIYQPGPEPESVTSVQTDEGKPASSV